MKLSLLSYIFDSITCLLLLYLFLTQDLLEMCYPSCPTLENPEVLKQQSSIRTLIFIGDIYTGYDYFY